MPKKNKFSKNKTSGMPILILLVVIIVTSFYAVINGKYDVRSKAYSNPSPTPAHQIPQIKCGISANIQSAKSGQTFTYHIWMQNAGTETLSNMIWKNIVDSPYIILDRKSIGGNMYHGKPEYCTINTGTKEINCVYPSVPPGDILNDYYQVTVINGAPEKEWIYNIVRVASDQVAHEAEYCSSISSVQIINGGTIITPTPTKKPLVTPFKSPVCIDSDNGDDFQTAGTCRDNTGIHSDSCGYGNMHRVLYEWHCVKGKNVCEKTEYLCDRECNKNKTACLP
jgi:uncharacterized repeat protein (TIGR01451 family)